MKMAEKWNEEYQKLGSTRIMPDWIKQIQLDAWKQGMTDASLIAENTIDEREFIFIHVKIMNMRDSKTTI